MEKGQWVAKQCRAEDGELILVTIDDVIIAGEDRRLTESHKHILYDGTLVEFIIDFNPYMDGACKNSQTDGWYKIVNCSDIGEVLNSEIEYIRSSKHFNVFEFRNGKLQ